MFLDKGYEKAPIEKIRPRVREGLNLFYEYVCSYLSESYFDMILTNFLKVRKFLKEKFEIELDMKSRNPNFGKKNTFKKSQVRSVIEVTFLPVFCGTIVLMTLLCTPIFLLCIGKQKKEVK